MTWEQGKYVKKSDHIEWDKNDIRFENERLNKMVVLAETNDILCTCSTSDNAVWVARRLNLADKLEVEGGV